MTISPQQFQEMLRRVEQNAHRLQPPAKTPETGAALEIPEIHRPIVNWCLSQIPHIPFIHHRTDKRSGIQEGAPDFVIVYRGDVLLIECKSKTGKLSEDQHTWKWLAEKQSVPVHIVRSYEEFISLIAACDSASVGEGSASGSDASCSSEQA